MSSILDEFPEISQNSTVGISSRILDKILRSRRVGTSGHTNRSSRDRFVAVLVSELSVIVSTTQELQHEDSSIVRVTTAHHFAGTFLRQPSKLLALIPRTRVSAKNFHCKSHMLEKLDDLNTHASECWQSDMVCLAGKTCIVCSSIGMQASTSTDSGLMDLSHCSCC